MEYKILIVDDVQADLDCTALVLSEDPELKLTITTSADEAVGLVRKSPDEFAAVLLDYQMPKDGLTLAEEMLAINPQLIIAILSADESREVLKKCIAIGVKDFIEKTEEEEVIRSIVRGLCQKWDSRPQIFHSETGSDSNEKLISSIGLVGRSQKIAELARTVRKVSRVEANIFIHGESGVGKELVARAIHNLSRRKSRPFVAINVAAINENLAESELFGHVKGAFTGADRRNEGKLLSANGGTLFLDEIGDLHPHLQVKLLRVLQERKVTPVGGSRATDLDVRLITATHVDLEKALLDGRFREDLYFRIHVIPLEIPPLRERIEDIGPMIAHFLKIHGGEGRKFSTKTVRLLERYHWRGNVREILESCGWLEERNIAA